MAFNSAVLSAIEQLDYRVTVGDVATQSGLDLNTTQQELNLLATDAAGHLQVDESGEVAYVFPNNFRALLRAKYWQIRAREVLSKVWQGAFYLIRISFGIILIISILIIVIALSLLVIGITSSNKSSKGDNQNDTHYRPSSNFAVWVFPDLRRLFGGPQMPRSRQASLTTQNGMNWLEAIFSFLFGDGNPNADLEERRWQAIGHTIRQHQGAVIAAQIAPYCDQVDPDEDFMLAVLSRFNGYPQVTETGDLIYTFPDLQVSTQETIAASKINTYLEEAHWSFSRATQPQLWLAGSLGVFNCAGAIALGLLLTPETIATTINLPLSNVVLLANSLYGVLLTYGIGFLVIPTVRYFWLKKRNAQSQKRNLERRDRAEKLQNPEPELKAKLTMAQQWASQKIITEQNLAYTTETELLDQELDRTDQIDAQWRDRLESGETTS